MNVEISKDVTGHLADDGKTVVKPLEGKSAKEVFEAHNQPGTPAAAFCKCAHCLEHQQLAPATAPAT